MVNEQRLSELIRDLDMDTVYYDKAESYVKDADDNGYSILCEAESDMYGELIALAINYARKNLQV